jgi:hypothetical protein
VSVAVYQHSRALEQVIVRRLPPELRVLMR